MRPAWLDHDEYPFAPHWLDVEGGRLHYVDEGRGDAIVMVHGTPTWSFLYRHLIKTLRGRHRCVVPDLLGFGLSDKPYDADYRPEVQARRLTLLIEQLGLRDLTLVVHDFGGPIGLSYALDHVENVRRLVLFNTWLWSFEGDWHVEVVGKLFSTVIGRILDEWFNFSVRGFWRSALGDRSRYTRAVHAHYLGPLDTPATRRATWIYVRELLGSSAWYDHLWERRDRLQSVPALLVWGMKDPAFGRYLPRWRAAWPAAEVVTLPDVGHAPMEERPEAVLPVIEKFLLGGMKETTR